MIGNRMRLRISVAMCTYNGSQFLPAQLQSIAAQTRPPDELVISDDCSSDRTCDIATRFARTAPFPVLVFRNARNIGSTKNFEKAISLCAGTHIALADQDDVWYPQKLTSIEAAFRKRPSAVAVFSDADLIDPDGNAIAQRLWNSFRFSRSEQGRFAQGDALTILAKHPVVTGATMAFRGDRFPLLMPLLATQIHDRWMSFLLAASGGIVPISTPLMSYRVHQNQQVGTGDNRILSRFAQASRTGPDFYFDEIRQFRELAEKLTNQAGQFPFARKALAEIEKKIAHRRHRAELPSSALSRVFSVLCEAASGRYSRYSEGWQSIAKDLAGLAPSSSTRPLADASASKL